MKQFENALIASRALNMIDDRTINSVLMRLSEAAIENCERIIAANKLDLDMMSVDNPMYDRLLLNCERIEGIAADIVAVAKLPSPLGKTLSQTTRPNGMVISKVTVPFGVIGVIYEARPNVSFDVFSICLKSGNACILKGGSDAHNSNMAIVDIIRRVLADHGLDQNTVTLLPADRSATAQLLGAVGYVDLIIPRGSRSLIDYVRDNARIPVIETGAGICHTYLDRDGDPAMAADIVFNSKTRRVSVCNALDTLVIHADRLQDLGAVCERLATRNVIIYADPCAYEALESSYPSALLRHATEESFGTEFLSYAMSVKTVDSIEEAVEHVTRYSSRHSEAIVTSDKAAAEFYTRSIDAACVYVNVSTAFTDGAQFGLGAEIGISTQKLHARGPMALNELTTYKYIIEGNGQVRQ